MQEGAGYQDRIDEEDIGSIDQEEPVEGLNVDRENIGLSPGLFSSFYTSTHPVMQLIIAAHAVTLWVYWEVL